MSKLFGSDEIELDASCGMFGKNKKLMDEVFFGKLKSKGGEIVHTGG